MAEVMAPYSPLTEDGVKLSPQMLVQPLVRGQVAKYKLIESDEDDPTRSDLNGKPLKKTPGYLMAGKKEIHDQFAGRTVTIMNKGITKTIKTQLGNVSTTRPGSVKFLSDKPVIEVTWDKPELYAFLERADENKDNPFRNPKATAKYYRLDARKKAAQQAEKDEFELEALNWVSKTASYTDLKACAEYVMRSRKDIKIKTDYSDAEASLGYQLLKREVYALAKKEPHLVIKGSTKRDTMMKMQLIDAENLQLIMFVDSKSPAKSQANTWFHNDKELTSICTVGVSENKHDALLNFIATDKEGGKHYKKIVEGLETFLKPQ